MIRQIFAFILIAGVLGLLIISADTSEGKIEVARGNTEKRPLEIEPGKYVCKESGTIINDLFNTAQAVMPNGDTYFLRYRKCVYLAYETAQTRRNRALGLCARYG